VLSEKSNVSKLSHPSNIPAQLEVGPTKAVMFGQFDIDVKDLQ